MQGGKGVGGSREQREFSQPERDHTGNLIARRPSTEAIGHFQLAACSAGWTHSDQSIAELDHGEAVGFLR